MTPFKPMPRDLHTATLINNKLYFLGGFSGVKGGWGGAELSLNQVYMYDIINDSWNIKATSGNIPSNRDGFSAVLGLDSQRVIIFGGTATVDFENLIPEDSLYVLNLISYEWYIPKNSGQIPASRMYHRANVIGNYMVVSFGTGYNQLTESDILLLDISNNVEYIWTYNFAPSIILPTSSSAVASTSVIQSSTIATSSTNSSTLPQQSVDKSSTPMIVVILGSLLGGTLFSFGCFFLYRWNKNKQKQKDVIHYNIYNQDMTSTERNIHNYEQEINNNNQEIIVIPRNENITNHEPIIPAPVISRNYNHGQEGIPITNTERYSSQDLDNLKNVFRQEILNYHIGICVTDCVCIILVPNIEGEEIKNYTTKVDRSMVDGTRCRIWIEDKYQYRIAGDGKGDYNDCGMEEEKVITFQTELYWVNVKNSRFLLLTIAEPPKIITL
ncbi:hypothetical protein C1645_742531 [Glomus cerebriforme]|uniref:Galactose oxidase n=1 Tax=Glomus cerebriforme TaxID=658196 RepID=A0A397SHP5_9GLOM|nr:hypothetical protein C1645_742531 [Glomus cerebriforme]